MRISIIPIVLAAALLAPTAAFADVACDVKQSASGMLECQARATDWLAPFDDQPRTQVRLFGCVPVAANESRVDRVLRAAVGVGLFALAAEDPTSINSPVLRGSEAGVGLVMLWTSLTGACPLYGPLGVNTRNACPAGMSGEPTEPCGVDD